MLVIDTNIKSKYEYSLMLVRTPSLPKFSVCLDSFFREVVEVGKFRGNQTFPAQGRTR